MDNMYIWIDLFKDVGFPIAIAGYLLIRFEKKIDSFSGTIEKLKETVQTKNNE